MAKVEHCRDRFVGVTSAVMASEIEVKTARLGEFLDHHHLDGVLLTLRSNFAWITAGKCNRIANNTPVGVATILATRDGKRVCLANRIEAPRFRDEELVGTGIETVEFPWYDGAAGQKIVRELIAGRKVAADSETFGLHLPQLPGDFTALRWELTPEEVERYRSGASRASKAIEKACRALKPGMSEHEAAGILDHEVHNVDLNPVVCLVSSDDRLPRFRHPIATTSKFKKHVMLVTCAEANGLVISVTRFVRFGQPTAEEKAKQQAVCNIDAAVNLATKPGRTLGQIFADLQAAYAANGYADEWKNHHQGGSAGYAPREIVATPGSPVPVMNNQAYAWNPSVSGAKNEDTVLATTSGIEVLTAHSSDWPTVIGKSPAGELRRADVLNV